MKAIIKKELRLYFTTPAAYVFIGIFVCISALLFTVLNLLNGNSSISVIFSSLPYVFVIMIPILTMRLMSEEKALKTDQLLLTAPITVTAIVLGKLLAALIIFAFVMVLMLMYPVILSFYSDVEWGIVVSNYLGFFLMGTSFISIGIFVSSLTENQLISAVVTIAVLFLTFIAAYMIPQTGVALVDFILGAVSVPKHFDTFFIGLVDLGEIVYYLSVCVVFVILTISRSEKRR